MLEAYQRGFTRVIWIDSAAVPLCNPKSLFDWFDQHPALIRGWPSPHDLWQYIFPRTRGLLKSLTGTDVLQTTYVNTIVFGLKMNSDLALALIKEYYYMAELGFPFLSCFPEEFVLTALLNQPHFRQAWQPAPFRFLVGSSSNHEAEEATLQRCRNGRCAFFYHRRH